MNVLANLLDFLLIRGTYSLPIKGTAAFTYIVSYALIEINLIN